jgi:hypothetical protein
MAGLADVVQLTVRANATQTSDLVVFEQSDGTDVFTVDNAGNVDIAGAIDNGLVAWWPLDEGTGDVIADKSTKSNDGAFFDCGTSADGWIAVPGNSDYGTSNFCVMKYEAKCTTDVDGKTCDDVNGIPVSQAANRPWRTNISQEEAITACQRAGGHLLTDNEAQTINRNIEAITTNWFGGVVGTNFMFSGHNDDVYVSPYNQCLAATSDDSDGYYGTGDSISGCDGEYNNCVVGEDTIPGRACAGQKRTMTLSNGEVIWDWSGNVWEWFYGDGADGTIGTTGSVSWRSAANWQEWTIAGVDGLDEERDVLGSSSSSWDSDESIGKYYGGISTNAFRRGGDWAGGAYAGAFALALHGAPANTGNGIGFRCAR